MKTLKINGASVSFTDGTTVAAAILSVETSSFRKSVSGESRLPLCGMGTCFECRVTIDGVSHRRSCQTPVEDGMEIGTD
ncbi:MAG: (2Fe-2S)-binding protein [Acidobacteria bacterium]|nr:(2Fe-2S)-binding protein [Acidobacteriota bacterium]